MHVVCIIINGSNVVHDKVSRSNCPTSETMAPSVPSGSETPLEAHGSSTPIMHAC